MSVRGWVKGCYWEARGSELVADAAIGATVLQVEWAGEFDDDVDDTSVGMWLDLNGTQLPYVSVDNDADTITLASPLTFAAGVDDRVLVVSGGQVMLDYIARVDLGSGDPAEVIIPFGDRDLWPEGDYVDPVQVLLSDDLENIIEVPGRTPSRDGTFITNPEALGVLAADTPWTHSVWDTIHWVVDPGSIDITYDAATGKFTILRDGTYLLILGIGFASSAVNVRGASIQAETAAGAVLLRRIRIPSDGITQVEATRAWRFKSGESIYFEAYQNSGDPLDLLSSTTNFSIHRIAA